MLAIVAPSRHRTFKILFTILIVSVSLVIFDNSMKFIKYVDEIIVYDKYLIQFEANNSNNDDM